MHAGNFRAPGCGGNRYRGRRLRLRPWEERLRKSRTVDAWSRSGAPWSRYHPLKLFLELITTPKVRSQWNGAFGDRFVSVRQLHREFLRAGSNVMQTFTFYASDDKLENRGHTQRFTVSEYTVFLCRHVAAAVPKTHAQSWWRGWQCGSKSWHQILHPENVPVPAEDSQNVEVPYQNQKCGTVC